MHLNDIFAHVSSYNELTAFAIPYVAETLLKDNYTTDVHTCLQQAPEFKFPCNHMICQGCCVGLGQRAYKDPNLFTFASCPICSAHCNVHIRLQPATAGVRVLSIDGGGVRAVVPIQFLRALENALGLDMPIQEHFDVSYGTSSVNLALYGLGLRLDEVYNMFKELSKRIFRGRVPFGIGVAAAAHSIIASLRKGQFPAEDIDGPLAELLGEFTMLDNSYMMSIGARIGFPVVNLKTLKTFIITSYNGIGKGPDTHNLGVESTYRVLRSDGPENEILIKDAIRCASAAPWYFTPHHIPNHGTYINGGLSSHNPGRWCCRNYKELIRAFVALTSLSLSHYIQYNFNGEHQFSSMRDMIRVTSKESTDVHPWMHRFNLPLDEELPNLADAQSIDSLGRAAEKYFTDRLTIHHYDAYPRMKEGITHAGVEFFVFLKIIVPSGCGAGQASFATANMKAGCVRDVAEWAQRAADSAVRVQ
ncbi:FabD/lysophospholipase-like protein [Ophiobolus disseminans]|uniref:FabD/lysophospholipase-like protein n=1 Tax=Ophiobolus disseminans TaxID=1469910 RepID=A0A6A6ZI68_9PLEO|nr:FabD/lysophospholipase-like protein [Ophiobolus disseminans]